ncbi:MAG TPA: PilN domain-containing protein [Gemmatimonadaceae bacterium]|nr:PilN domain-containing protein [Gemmatimonadaceae bacterium]
MIEINLLPGARKAKRGRAAKVDFGAVFGNLSAKIRDPYLIGAIASVVVALLAVGGMWLYQNRRVASLTERETVAVQDSTRYAAVIAQRSAAEAQRDSVVRQINIIRAIDGSRFIWPHVLDEVSRALPPYVWLRQLNQTSAVSNLSPEIEAGLSGEAKGKSKLAAQADSAAAAAGTLTWRIIGQTVDIQAMTRFMKQLDASPWIENVQLTKTDLVILQPGNKEATEFTLDMKLQQPDSAAIRLVPLKILVR